MSTLRNLRYYAPSLGQSWLLVLIFVFLGSFLGAIPKLVSGNSVFWESTSVFYLCAMLPVFVFIYFKAKMEYQKYEVVELTAPRKINSPSFGSLPPVLVFFLAGLATLCISVIIEPLVSLIPMPDSIKELFEMLFYKSSPIDSFISVIILAPLCEEFLCRGMMLRGMLEHISPIKAILWSAFLFALLHLNPWQAIPAFALGAFFGWVYWKSGSIWLVIFLHFVNNFSAMILARFFPDLPIDVALSDMLSTGWYALTYAVAIIVFTCITLLFIKKLNSTDGKKTLSAEIPADSEN